MRFWQRLPVKLTAWVVIALFLLTGAAALIASRALENESVHSILQTGAWFSDTVKRATRFSMLKDQRDSVHAIIEAIGQQEGVEVIRVFNKQGRVMFSSRKSETGEIVDMQAEACYACHFKDRPLERLPQSERSRIFTMPASEGSASHRVLGFITPIYTEKVCYTDPCHAHPPEQKVLGVLDVGLSLKEVDEQVAASTSKVVGFAVVICLVVIALMGIISFFFLNRPLSGLVSATRHITRGDYDHPVQFHSPDEIGQLAQYFETMRQSVKEKTEDLEESRRRFKALFEQVPCHISVQDRDFKLVAVNSMFERNFGSTIGAYCYQAYKGRDSICPHCAVEKTFADGRVHSSEETVRGKDGELRYFLNLTAPITDKEGNIVSVMEMATDVTELRHLENELRKSEEKYRLFFNNDPNAIFVVDRESLEILDANDRATADYGFSRQELLGTSFPDLAEGPERARIKDALDGGQSLLSRVHLVKKNGAVFLANLRAAYGEYLGREAMIVAAADITETLETEQQLVQAAKMATLGEMSAGVAHELNQPLSILSTAGNILRKQVEKNQPLDPAIVGEVAQELADQVQRATRIINHLREFGRKPEVERAKVEVAEPINGVFQLLGQQMRVRDIKVDVDIEPGLPPIWGEINRLEQVLLNLVLNARDAIEERQEKEPGIVGSIQVTARSMDGLVEITVADNGSGVPPELAERIFEPFFTTKEVGKGTGLGLSISYGIVRDYGGSIEVKSEPGKGTRFRMSFQPARDEV